MSDQDQGRWQRNVPLPYEKRILVIRQLDMLIDALQNVDMVAVGLLSIVKGAYLTDEEPQLYQVMKAYAIDALQRAEDNQRFLRLAIDDMEGDDDE